MSEVNWKEITMQFVVGALYGASIAYLVAPTMTTGALIAAGVGALKGGAQAIAKALQPRTVAQSQQFQAQHWTETLQKYL